MHFYMQWGALVSDGDGEVDLDLSLKVSVTRVLGDAMPEIEIEEIQAIDAETGAPLTLSSEIEQDLIDCPKLTAAILHQAAERRQYERDEAADNKREMMKEAAHG